MPIIVTMALTLDPDIWGSDEEWSGDTDEKIIEVVLDDIAIGGAVDAAVLAGGVWTVTRTSGSN